MENASKALIMAGSVLIALLVIGLLVIGYNQLSGLEQTRTDSDVNQKMVEYMRQFEQFNRTLYGSELLSLANVQEDYNTSEAREDVGYDRIEITVRINQGIVGSTYFVAGTHSLETIADDQKKLENDIASYETTQRKYNNRSVKYYSQKRYREIAIDFGMDPPSNMADYDIEYYYLRSNSTTTDLLNEIQEYTNLTSIYTEFRTGKRFRCTDVQYNNSTGRISSMYFVEI